MVLKEQYLATIKSQNSKTMYASAIQLLEKELGCPFELIDLLMARNYKQIMMYKVKSGKLSIHTVSFKLSAFRSYGQFLIQNLEEYDDCPFLSLSLPSVKKQMNLLHTPSIEECDKLLSLLDENSDYFLIFALSLRCCLGTSIICNMRAEQFCTSAEGAIFFKYTTEKLSQTIQIPSDIVPYVMPRISRGGFFFLSRKGLPLSERTLRYRVRSLLDCFGFESYTLEDFKNRGILEMMAAGVPSSEVAAYAGLTEAHLNYYKTAHKHMVDKAPCELSRIRIMCHKQQAL